MTLMYWDEKKEEVTVEEVITINHTEIIDLNKLGIPDDEKITTVYCIPENGSGWYFTLTAEEVKKIVNAEKV